ncbi:hypothetical protein PCANC_12031 [Puccinia coronata f. sp. avenae]|uniref:Uncharacterized protein n=1 Tax=Puccinia coronata f. sp. avenae TaxID=200324 RepID=A0A2N5UUU4_9BASI|nr:hypothetical protein PCANC_12031 [Puccinia coronata f. sp. avenae]
MNGRVDVTHVDSAAIEEATSELKRLLPLHGTRHLSFYKKLFTMRSFVALAVFVCLQAVNALPALPGLASTASQLAHQVHPQFWPAAVAHTVPAVLDSLDRVATPRAKRKLRPRPKHRPKRKPGAGRRAASCIDLITWLDSEYPR